MRENERFRKLPKKYERAITALLGTATQAEAALLIGVDVSTLRRWMDNPEFQDAFRAARLKLMESTVSRLQRVAEKAVASLERNLNCGQFATEVRAAVAVLENATKGIEQLDMANRMAALEELVKSKMEQESTH